MPFRGDAGFAGVADRIRPCVSLVGDVGADHLDRKLVDRPRIEARSDQLAQ